MVAFKLCDACLYRGFTLGACVGDSVIFDPFDLALDVTPENVKIALQRGDLLGSLILAFRCVQQGQLSCGLHSRAQRRRHR